MAMLTRYILFCSILEKGWNMRCSKNVVIHNNFMSSVEWLFLGISYTYMYMYQADLNYGSNVCMTGTWYHFESLQWEAPELVMSDIYKS